MTLPQKKERPQQSFDPENRNLQVVHKRYGQGYTIGFNLQGEYLKRYGFEYRDKVKVEVSRNRIIIEKLISE